MLDVEPNYFLKENRFGNILENEIFPTLALDLYSFLFLSLSSVTRNLWNLCAGIFQSWVLHIVSYDLIKSVFPVNHIITITVNLFLQLNV